MIGKATRASCVGLAFCLASSLGLTVAAAETPRKPVSVVIITDFPDDRTSFQSAIVDEIADMLGDDHGYEVRPAGGNPLTASKLLDEAYADPAVKVVLAAGIVSTALALPRKDFPKPTMALAVIDPELQGAPL